VKENAREIERKREVRAREGMLENATCVCACVFVCASLLRKCVRERPNGHTVSMGRRMRGVCVCERERAKERERERERERVCACVCV